MCVFEERIKDLTRYPGGSHIPKPRELDSSRLCLSGCAPFLSTSLDIARTSIDHFSFLFFLSPEFDKIYLCFF